MGNSGRVEATGTGGLGWSDGLPLVASDSLRTRELRLLQSWFRAEHLGVHPDQLIGSRLRREDVDERPWLNFIHPAAFTHAIQRQVDVQRERGTLEVDRLRRNMLSSMPLAFNVFASLASTPQASALFGELFGLGEIEVVEVICEWAPRPPERFLQDRSAFDTIVFYRRTSDHTLGFVGIEVKYSEPFSPRPYPGKGDIYSRITDTSGWFHPGAALDLVQPPTNQLWRTVMLAAAMEMAGTWGTGNVAVVALQDDRGASRAMTGLAAWLTDPDRVRLVPLEQIVLTAERHGREATIIADRLDQRYLNRATRSDGHVHPLDASDWGRPSP